MNNEKMLDKLNNLVSTIPYELQDCFYLILNEKYSILFKENIEKLNIKLKEIENPLSYKNIPLIFTDKNFIDCNLEIIPKAKYILRIKNYEEIMFDNFIEEYKKISKKYNIEIRGCGCCDSPYIDNLYVIYVDNINVSNGEVKYDKGLKLKYKQILEKELKEEGK